MDGFRRVVEQAMRKHETVVAFLSCEITYSGRAETFLEQGDRVLLLKSDRTVIVHQPQGSMPVNYMKSGSEIFFEEQSIRIVNAKEKSWLNLRVFEVYNVASARLQDGGAIDLAGNERDLSDWIRDNPECISEDFVAVAREEMTDVGFIDVFGHNGNGSLVVVECKRVTASLSAVDQLRRYVERVKTIRGTDKVKGYIAAPAVTPNALQMLSSHGFQFREVQPPKRLEQWLRNQRKLAEY